MVWKKFVIGSLTIVSALCGCMADKTAATAGKPEVEFAVTADIRKFSDAKHTGPDFFDGVCEAIVNTGAGEFMISPGDIDPPEAIRDTLDRYMGSNYVWYPVVGNHEAETPADMQWLRRWGRQHIPGLVRRGPAGSETTTFSFDHGPAHFVILNQYFDGTADNKGKGDVVKPLYDWLKKDLEENRKPMVIVVGHEPILPAPDMDNGRLRHETDSLNSYPENCREFHDLLVSQRVTAYLCAHTHNASITNLGGLWQVDAGHARGKGDPGAASTFLKVRAGAAACTVEFHRQLKPGEPYTLTHTFQLRRPQ